MNIVPEDDINDVWGYEERGDTVMVGPIKRQGKATKGKKQQW